MLKANYQRYAFFDQMSLLQADNYTACFPLHAHDVYSITLVRSGRETTRVKDKELIAPAGCISVTFPDELHANPNLNLGTYDFTTYYLSPTVLAYFNQGKGVHFLERVIHDVALFQALDTWSQSAEATETSLAQILKTLINKYSTKQEPTGLSYSSVNLRQNICDAVAYIQQHLADKITLADLARISGLSPPHFLRLFKKEKGLTPIQFITLSRIEAAKKLMLKGNSVTETAHTVGFFDQSHFHRFFLRYAGVTPKKFMLGSKIVQV